MTLSASTVVLRKSTSQESSPSGLIRRRQRQHLFTRRAWKGRWVGASIPDDHPAVGLTPPSSSGPRSTYRHSSAMAWPSQDEAGAPRSLQSKNSLATVREKLRNSSKRTSKETVKPTMASRTDAGGFGEPCRTRNSQLPIAPDELEVGRRLGIASLAWQQPWPVEDDRQRR